MSLYDDLNYIWRLLEKTHNCSYELINAVNKAACQLIIKAIYDHKLKVLK
jgi:hypothetical protein